jgi:hypothetical protein
MPGPELAVAPSLDGEPPVPTEFADRVRRPSSPTDFYVCVSSAGARGGFKLAGTCDPSTLVSCNAVKKRADKRRAWLRRSRRGG